jgi:hypothetical protein
MDFTPFAQDAGCLDTATEDIVRRLQAHFQDEEPSPQAVQTWLRETLRPAAAHLFGPGQQVWDKVGMTKDQFDAMPVAWRLSQGMADQARVHAPHPRRPVARDAPADKLAEWQALPMHERVAAYRSWRDGESQG